MKILVFDMDGTIANLYAEQNWLEKLRNYNPSPYINAQPLYDMEAMKTVLEMLKLCGYMIVVTSWLSRCSTPEYDAEVTKAKREWLDKYGFPYDMLNVVPNGMNKSLYTKDFDCPQILIDDDKKVRATWENGDTFDAKKGNVLDFLMQLLIDEKED